ncbi:hypothetical protein TNCV_338201 [Trichonephila clavipes]|nr:hypothetical protein TNCV_338201 [Trichonephila clavipes]
MPSFHDPLRLFLFANNQIGDPWKKRTWHLSDSRAYRQYEAENKRLFRDAIQLAIIDAKTPTTVFFLTSTTGDDQGLSEAVNLSVFVKSPENFRVVRIACFSVRHLTRVTSLTNNSSVTPKFLAGHPSNPMCRK